MPQTIDEQNGAKRSPNPGKTRDPRAILSGFYAAKFGHLGIVLPFLAPWFQSRGLGAASIGVMLALPPLFKILAPWTWGRWADRSGKRRELLCIGAAVSATALVAMTFADRIVLLGSLMAVYAFTRAPVLPYLEATSLEQREHLDLSYGPIRLWGSVSFVVLSGGYGALAATLHPDAGLWIAAALLALCSALAVRLPAPDRPASTGSAGPPARAPRPGSDTPYGIVHFFVACALMQVSHGAYYTFYSIHLGELGYGPRTIGGLWALAVICEVLLLTRLDRIVQRFGTGRVLRASLMLATVRWLIIGSCSALPWLALGQTLHAATYAAFHVAAIGVVFRHFGRGARARGQAMYSGMTFGVGMFVGNLTAGWLAEPLGLPTLYLASAGVAFVALAILGFARGRPGYSGAGSASDG
jgi:PPP family 3-phenylpropionic acid transporter